MLIKVCGVKYSENARALSELDIDYLGHIFYSKSPRNIDFDLHFDFNINQKRVGVFVDANIDFISEKIKSNNLSVVQLHGDESAEFCEKVKDLGVEVFKAFGIDENFEFEILNDFEGKVNYFVFDTKTDKKGGSGKKFNWQILNKYNNYTGFLLSGGIGPKDVSEIKKIKHQQFAGLDLNSGFEIEPGLKNTELLKQFLLEINN